MSFNGGFDYSTGNSFGGFGGENPMGGGDAGGFMGTQGSPAGMNKKGKGSETIITLTIRQLKGATQEHQDDAWKIDGVELKQVKVVGNILKVEETSTFTKYDIEDSTGMVEVKVWLDAGEDEAISERRSACREGMYVRVIGKVGSYQDQLNIMGYDVRVVEDHNEVTHHFLEAIYHHCQRTKPAPQAQPVAGGWNAQSSSMQQPMSNGNQLTGTMAQEDNGTGVSGVQGQVLAYFNQHDSNDDDGTGLSLFTVAAALQQQGIQEKDVRSAVDFLANEGHLYSTIDENHYKSTAY